MTKRELSQLYFLKKEIKEQQCRVTELEALATNSTTKITGMPHSKSVSDKVGKYAAEIADLKHLLEENVQKSLQEICRLDEFIQNIKDSEIRTILRLRYIENLTWQKIAFRIGKYDEQLPRKKHDEFLLKASLDIFI